MTCLECEEEVAIEPNGDHGFRAVCFPCGYSIPLKENTENEEHPISYWENIIDTRPSIT